ncbi:MAG: hypothetical protein JKP95_03080 [Oceanicaulis sp.]|nr:hypothetical protein [Oceanicaulis sp.]
MKDPRCTLYADLASGAAKRWLCAGASADPSRPAEVAQSLAHRDKFTADEAGLLWAWYSLKALKAFQSDGGVVVSYSGLRQDWRGVMDTVRSGLGLDGLKVTPDAAAQIDDFLKEPRSRADADFSVGVAEILTAITDLHGKAEAGDVSDDPRGWRTRFCSKRGKAAPQSCASGPRVTSRSEKLNASATRRERRKSIPKRF